MNVFVRMFPLFLSFACAIFSFRFSRGEWLPWLISFLFLSFPSHLVSLLSHDQLTTILLIDLWSSGCNTLCLSFSSFSFSFSFSFLSIPYPIYSSLINQTVCLSCCFIIFQSTSLQFNPFHFVALIMMFLTNSLISITLHHVILDVIVSHFLV